MRGIHGCIPLLNELLIESFHWARMSVFFRYTVDMLVSNNVQCSMRKKHFHRRYGQEQRRQLTVQVLHNTDNSILTSIYANLGQAAMCFAP